MVPSMAVGELQLGGSGRNGQLGSHSPRANGGVTCYGGGPCFCVYVDELCDNCSRMKAMHGFLQVMRAELTSAVESLRRIEANLSSDGPCKRSAVRCSVGTTAEILSSLLNAEPDIGCGLLQEGAGAEIVPVSASLQ